MNNKPKKYMHSTALSAVAKTRYDIKGKAAFSVEKDIYVADHKIVPLRVIIPEIKGWQLVRKVKQEFIPFTESFVESRILDFNKYVAQQFDTKMNCPTYYILGETQYEILYVLQNLQPKSKFNKNKGFILCSPNERVTHPIPRKFVESDIVFVAGKRLF